VPGATSCADIDDCTIAPIVRIAASAFHPREVVNQQRGSA